MRELHQLASDKLGPPLVRCSDLDLITAASDENGIRDVVVVCDVVAVPYSGKLSREKTFKGENFRDFRGFVAIRKSFLHEICIFHQFAKVSSLSNTPK